jgi:hypothetical protein
VTCCIFYFVDVNMFQLPLHPLRADSGTVNNDQYHCYRRCLETSVPTDLVKTVSALTKLWNFIIYFFAHFPSIYAWISKVVTFLQKNSFPMSRDTCPVSHVMCYLSRFSCHVMPVPFPMSRDKVPFPMSRDACPVSHVTWHLARFPCHVIHVPFPMSRGACRIHLVFINLIILMLFV